MLTFCNYNDVTATPHGAGMTTSDVPCDADYIGNITARHQWFDTWKFIANRYLKANNIGWYEVASEPHLLHSAPDPKSPSGKPWRPCHTGAEVNSLFTGVVAAIRSVDPLVPIAAAPTGYGVTTLRPSPLRCFFVFFWEGGSMDDVGRQVVKVTSFYHVILTCATIC